MNIKKIIDNLELYTVGRPKKDRLFMTVEELQNLIDEIETLEQKPCEDCVSRQAVLEQTYLWSKDEFLRVTNPFDYLRKRINSLPPVTPQQKVGHWIYNKDDSDWLDVVYECSCCKREIIVPYESMVYKDYPYCHCGAKMVEPQKGEKKV